MSNSPNFRDNAIIGQVVRLDIQFYDINQEAIDADELPSVQVSDENDNVIYPYSDQDVYRIDVGLYRIEFEVPEGSDPGLFTDSWRSTIGGNELDTVFTFTVVNAETGLEPTTGLGKIRLADDVVFDFSDEEIYGINILLKFLKMRLRSDGVKPVRDEFGAFVYDMYGQIVTEECPVFQDDILIGFLCQALSEFNMIPFFTAYTFADNVIQNLFSQAIVEGAFIMAIGSQSIIEKGRDIVISDGGISFTPPQLGDYLYNYFSSVLTAYRERLKFIKNSIRPGPNSFGTFTNINSGSPAVMRLRHIRGRRIL